MTPARGELFARTAAELVVAERREELDRSVEVQQLDGGDGASAGRLLPGLERVDDVARHGHVLDPGELDPLDVTDDCEPHTSHLGAAVR